ncbi:hypothetical protein [Parafrankia soli]|uniref:hypothetical protein n=1 Tax=Parafrankia soli TaxID=2599596 RepID=UPI001041C1E0|nr:hypothetical protein [Parafrankia soli]
MTALERHRAHAGRWPPDPAVTPRTAAAWAAVAAVLADGQAHRWDQVELAARLAGGLKVTSARRILSDASRAGALTWWGGIPTRDRWVQAGNWPDQRARRGRPAPHVVEGVVLARRDA